MPGSMAKMLLDDFFVRMSEQIQGSP